jgi:hypothetical protein
MEFIENNKNVSQIKIHHYKCEIENNRVNPYELDGNKTETFKYPSTNAEKEKLYIVKSGSEFCYIGRTSRSISQRMYTGFHPHTKTGYHGYKWKHLKFVEIFVYLTNLDNLGTETIEAELVYLIRIYTGKWPIYQTEIHFHNPVENPNAFRQLAEELYRKTGGIIKV